ncbi:uncharacterized protein LOC124260788 [Haliotis rubra]|uniref:uncharacterized protein LOC124260788 n=1 Tax=Haliotis rubra TaxID=36100 RepID=UPI001EE603A6|nr:uncharacterized protein LOC124260788 [Haliotis rubra]
MDTMELLLQIAILFSVLMVKPCSGDSAIHERKYTKTALRDRTDVSADTLCSKRAVSLIQCSRFCSLNQRCHAFYFRRPNSMCTQYRVVHGNTSNLHVPSADLYVWIGQHTYVGCHIDACFHRVLPHGLMIDNIRMTIETCKLNCQGKGYPYFGTESGDECFCGNGLRPGKRPAPETECSMPCPGDKSTMCGGDLRISVYTVV